MLGVGGRGAKWGLPAAMMPVGNLVGVTERAGAHTAVLAFLVVSCGVCRSYQNRSVVGCGKASSFHFFLGRLKDLIGHRSPREKKTKLYKRIKAR